MKKLVCGALLGLGLCWPLLAHAGEREEKYVFLLVGGIGGMVVGAGLYGILMVLAATFVRRRVVALAAFGLCVAFLIYMQYTSFRILRVAASLGWELGLAPGTGTVALLLKTGLGVALLFGLVILRLALRMWRRRDDQRRRQAEC